MIDEQGSMVVVVGGVQGGVIMEGREGPAHISLEESGVLSHARLLWGGRIVWRPGPVV